MNSWEKSDSYVDQDGTEIGPNDLALMKKLCHAGPEPALIPAEETHA